MADYSRIRCQQVGWCYSQAGTPCAYIMDEGEPETAMFIPQPNWWNALRFAVTFARNNAAEYMGGPGQ